MIWQNKRTSLDLTRHTVVMGILNVTPDSFSDGGIFISPERAVERALQMEGEGAKIIDIGGESTRPGAEAMSVSEELKRVIPVISALRNQSDILISIDTSKPEVAQAAIDAGADIVNDVTGLTGGGSEMAQVCAQSGVGVIAMHMQGTPRSMQNNPSYPEEGGVVSSVISFFNERIKRLTSEGIAEENLCFDPGIGFGKTLEHNLELIKHLGRIQGSLDIRCPLLLGVSRKSFIGAVTGEELPSNRDVETATVTALAVFQGVKLHRVHNVEMSIKAIQMAETLL